MSAEAVALQLLVDVAPAAISAIVAAFDQGKSDAEALASARAHLPPRIDTSAEDAARRARVRAEVAAKAGRPSPGAIVFGAFRRAKGHPAPFWTLGELERAAWELLAADLEDGREDEPTTKIGGGA